MKMDLSTFLEVLSIWQNCPSNVIYVVNGLCKKNSVKDLGFVKIIKSAKNLNAPPCFCFLSAN